MTKYYRMPDGAIVASETDSDASPELLLETNERPTYDPYGGLTLPLRCELCVNRETCWQYVARKSSGRVCDGWNPFDDQTGAEAGD